MKTSVSTNDSVVQQGIELGGVEAASWMLRNGFVTTPTSAFRLVGDAIAADRLRLARLWHTAATLEHRRTGAGAGVTMIVVLDGEIVVHQGGGEVTVGSHGAIALAGWRDYAIVSAKPTARIEIGLDEHFLARHPTLSRSHDAVLSRSAFTNTLVAAVNTILSAGVGLEGAAGASVRHAIEHLTVAVVRAAHDQAAPLPITPDSTIYRRALAVIEARAFARELTVASLAAELSISVRHLQRVFAHADTSPMLEIRWARARLAEGLIHLAEDAGDLRSQAIVAATGFRTARTMRQAIRDLHARDRLPNPPGGQLRELVQIGRTV